MSDNKVLPIVLKDGKTIEFEIFANAPNTLFQLESSEAYSNNEASVQLQEGCFYEYRLTPGYSFAESEIVSPSQFNKSTGRLSPNVYVGNLTLEVLSMPGLEKCGQFELEIRSTKTEYREDYRTMLSDIAERCTELLLQHTSPVTQYFSVDFGRDASVLYQQFIFLKSVIQSEEFIEGIHKICSSPTVSWREIETKTDIRRIKKVEGKLQRQLAGGSNRMDVPPGHPLKGKLDTLPRELLIRSKAETIDTPENRFVKHVLTTFRAFCSPFVTKATIEGRLWREARLLIESIDGLLAHSIFREISEAKSLPLNSTILQRKEGYREVLRTWLRFDLAARLVWHGGEDIYDGGKKDVATLYEYWAYFRLLSVVKEVFKIEPKSLEAILQPTHDGFGLQLRQGKYLAIQGIFQTDTRRLCVEFSYNRTFTGDSPYPTGGSWTRNLRPDYTLTIWPLGLDQKQAEQEESIVHLHFDAKYKVEQIGEIFRAEEDLDFEKVDQKKGTYKRADILKMHTYRDAIRRTAGAYILYPGSEMVSRKGFHELLPGVGAFALRPSRSESGSQHLVNFLKDVVAHFLNRASQREVMSFRTYEVYKEKPKNSVVNLLPEPTGLKRGLLPEQTFVLVAYYKNQEHLDWILAKGLYNARTGGRERPFRLGPKEVGASFLLLHTKGELVSGKLYKVTHPPSIYAKEDLLKADYPGPSQEFYLVYGVDPLVEKEFEGKFWRIEHLDGFKPGRLSALPFSVSLAELMMTEIKKQ
jgi:predicted component of viral defense system (DUF524 family)